MIRLAVESHQRNNTILDFKEAIRLCQEEMEQGRPGKDRVPVVEWARAAAKAAVVDGAKVAVAGWVKVVVLPVEAKAAVAAARWVAVEWESAGDVSVRLAERQCLIRGVFHVTALYVRSAAPR